MIQEIITAIAAAALVFMVKDGRQKYAQEEFKAFMNTDNGDTIGLKTLKNQLHSENSLSTNQYDWMSNPEGMAMLYEFMRNASPPREFYEVLYDEVSNRPFVNQVMDISIREILNLQRQAIDSFDEKSIDPNNMIALKQVLYFSSVFAYFSGNGSDQKIMPPVPGEVERFKQQMTMMSDKLTQHVNYLKGQLNKSAEASENDHQTCKQLIDYYLSRKIEDFDLVPNSSSDKSSVDTALDTILDAYGMDEIRGVVEEKSVNKQSRVPDSEEIARGSYVMSQHPDNRRSSSLVDQFRHAMESINRGQSGNESKTGNSTDPGKEQSGPSMR